MITTVTIWYLQICDRDKLRPRYMDEAGTEILQSRIPSPEFSRFLYTAVGGDLYWTERLPWNFDRWFRFLNRPEVETWVLWKSGTPGGYAELERQPDGSTKITYFGLLPMFVGHGYGAWLLTHAIERGFDLGKGRVWVHTCSLDTPAARPNYEARGMTVYRKNTFQRNLSIPGPGPWPRAKRPGYCPTEKQRRS